MSAALCGLYKPNVAGGSRSKITSYGSLHTSEMKELTRVLSGVPFPSERMADEKYAANVTKLIKDLPSNLTSSVLTNIMATEDKDTAKVKHKCLCKLHKGLNPALAYSIWNWIRHELDDAIGPFIFPVLMASLLTKPQEWAARQLEPVLRMYRPDFTEKGATPPGFQAVASEKWGFQKNQCPACMLARIGSDAAALTALISGIVGRSSTRTVGRVDKLCSKRVIMLKYWLRRHHDGENRFIEAFQLGEELRRCRRECKDRGLAPGSREQEVPIVLSLPRKRSVPRARGAPKGTPSPDSMPSTFSPFEPESHFSATTKSSTDTRRPREDSVINEDAPESFGPSPTGRKPNSVTSSIYSQPGITWADLSRPTKPEIPMSSVSHAIPKKPSVLSVSSEEPELCEARNVVFKQIPSYTSSDPDSPQIVGMKKLAPPLRRQNTIRKDEREEMLLPCPDVRRASIYAGFGAQGAASKQVTCEDVSDEEDWVGTPGTPGRHYDISPPMSPIDGGMKSPKRVTGMTHWSKFY